MKTGYLNSNTVPRAKGVYYYNELSIHAKINYKAMYRVDSKDNEIFISMNLIGFLKDSPVWVASILA